ncbi:MAG: CheR family methyltransferase, partial [Terriglobales bacterium]
MAIGASAGGLEAFHIFFDRMPDDTGMAFVVVLHLPADRKSMLSEILARWTAMRVCDVTDGMSIEPDTVYIPPPHSAVTLLDGRFSVREPAVRDQGIFRPVDTLFDSLAQSIRERAIGIVLSGTGNDGSLGLKSIKAAGGVTIVQGTNGTAPHYREMPAGAIATGSVDIVAPIEDIPEALLRIKRTRPSVPDEASTEREAARLEMCAILLAQLGHDFSGYRDQTFMRRVQRRMQVVNASTLSQYVQRLRADHEEAKALFRDLLIRVTSFFRDTDTFEILQAKVVPRLFAGKNANSTIRIWVPGCATGEEAYSLAMLMREQLDTLKGGAPRVQIFATDIDESAVAIARLGRYPQSLLEGLSVERRNRFFAAFYGTFAVSKELRELCTFSAHDLARDPPFSRLDMVSCRNLLIYMDIQLQATVIPRLHYALLPGGILLLGASESTAKHDELFEPLDKSARLFLRRDVKGPGLSLDAQASILAGRMSAAPGPTVQESERSDLQRTATQGTWAAGAQSSPDTFREDARDAAKHKRQTFWGKWFFGKAALERELLRAREELQSLSEEHQTALEELRSSNEELHSVNEELQSTNEELETSKEELQSVNEELHTVNVRLSEKIDELAHSNSDLRNLFESTEVATIFLDRHLVVRSYTPAVAALYNLIPSDEGRPLTDIVSHLAYETLSEDVDTVLRTLSPLERRIARDDRSMHYIMRLLPYREPDSSVSGVLITFVDVTSIVVAEEKLLDADLRKDVFLATLSHELRNPLAPIRTAARLLEMPNLADADLAHAQAIIARQVTHMSSLLDDLLDVSRITRGAFLLKRQEVELRVLMEAAAEAAQPAMDAKQHTLRVDYPQEPIALEVDMVRLTQVIGNLLTNAAKYTPKGGLISLGTRLEPQDICIFVRDNGIGIARGMMLQIFNMFTRIESDVGRTEGGLGIGLALARGLIELHGGRIEAFS